MVDKISTMIDADTVSISISISEARSEATIVVTPDKHAQMAEAMGFELQPRDALGTTSSLYRLDENQTARLISVAP